MLYNNNMKKKCNCGKREEVDGKVKTQKYIKLSRDIEANEEIIGEASVETLSNFRKKNATADLSIYKIRVE